MDFSLKKVIVGTSVAILLSSGVNPSFVSANTLNSPTDQNVVIQEQKLPYVELDNSILNREYDTIKNELIDLGPSYSTYLRISNVTFDFSNGGLNLYGHDTAGMKKVRNVLANSNNSVKAFSYLLGFGIGPILGLVTGETLSGLFPQFSDGERVISKMISQGWPDGGVRITRSGAKPLYYAP